MTTEMIRVFVGISVAFGIASVLAVSVVQRTREIGILRAMGSPRGQILRVFLLQGGLLGLLGSACGGLVGWGLVQVFNLFGPRLFIIPVDPRWCRWPCWWRRSPACWRRRCPHDVRRVTTRRWRSAMCERAPIAPAEEVLRLEQVRKAQHRHTLEAEVLHGIDLQLRRGELAALVGPSGSGKSTLLNLIGLLDTPSSGELYVLGQATRDSDDEARTQLRNQAIGFVFQFHHLISAFSVLENVLMPLMIRHGKPSRAETDLARALLEEVGLGPFADKKPTQISGGQQQRVAIARALVTRPPLLLADEPTGNLDTRTAQSVFELFHRLNAQFGCAILVVTHDPRLAADCERTIQLGRRPHRQRCRQPACKLNSAAAPASRCAGSSGRISRLSLITNKSKHIT